MRAMLRSLGEYVPAVLTEVWALGFGFVAGVIGAVALTVSGIQLVWWEWIIVALVCLTPAQFMAYHRALERYRQSDGQAPATTNYRTQINNYISFVFPEGPPPHPAPPQLSPAPVEPSEGDAPK